MANKKGRRHTRRFYQTMREFEELFSARELTEEAGRVSDRLSEMVGHLLCNSPDGGEFAATIYHAIGSAWDRNRDEYGHENLSHPLERQTVEYHGALLDDLRRAQSPETTAKENTLEQEAHHFAKATCNGKDDPELYAQALQYYRDNHHLMLDDDATCGEAEENRTREIEQAGRDLRVEGLKRRLEKLDDLEHEGMRFRVMQEIRDLENTADVDADEWPDIIAA
jgi:hypothetical protein